MRTSAWLLSALLLTAALSQAASPPVQSTMSILMPAANGESRRRTGELSGGKAGVTVRAKNVDVRTVRITLRYEYKVPPDTSAPDEVIDHVAVETAGETMILGRVRLDTNGTALSPNKSALVYQATLYRPTGEYRVRVRTYGNYR